MLFLPIFSTEFHHKKILKDIIIFYLLLEETQNIEFKLAGS
jgi:hypothetical protein